MLQNSFAFFDELYFSFGLLSPFYCKSVILAINETKIKYQINQPAVSKRFISFLLSHNSFAFVFVGDLIIAASNKEISIWKP